VIHTDGWPGYYGMEEKAYAHKVSNIKQSGGRAHKLMPRVHRVASLIKRWLLGTPTKARLALSVWTTTWTNSRSASTGERRSIGASFSFA